MPIFTIIAAIASGLKIAGVAGFVALSWWLIAAVALFPLVIVLVVMAVGLFAVGGLFAGAATIDAVNRRRR